MMTPGGREADVVVRLCRKRRWMSSSSMTRTRSSQAINRIVQVHAVASARERLQRHASDLEIDP
jgi:hypothetical protein